MLAGGCYSVSIATSTGDRLGGNWSTVPKQQAHVGETVEFSVMLTQPLTGRPVHARGAADYCALFLNGRRVDLEMDIDGRFHGTYAFDFVDADEKIRVDAKVYLTRGSRDFMQIRGEWLRNESPRDWPDHLVASGHVELAFYQSELRLEVPGAAGGFDLSTAKLILRRPDGTETTVFPYRPPRHGFSLTQQPHGGLLLTYRPRADEISPYGATQAVLSVYGHDGKGYQAEELLLTP